MDITFKVELYLEGVPQECIDPVSIPLSDVDIALKAAIEYCQKNFKFDEIKVTLKF